MKNLSKFQIIFLGIFVFFIVVALFIFSSGGRGGSSSAIELSVWGSVSKEQFSKMLAGSGLDKNETIRINYLQKNQDSFDIELLEALVDGTAPDIFFLGSDSILKHKQKVYTVSFKSFSEKDFKNSFAEAGEIFLTGDGILGFPILIDPLVMYWNRDIFQGAGLVKPPRLWDEVYDLAGKLTIKDGASVISRSGVALGEYVNINNSFEILSSLIMQAGNPIVEIDKNGNALSVIAQSKGFPIAPAESALNFYTEFSNPLRSFYSWNKALPPSKSHFIAGELAIYFGLASELFEIRDKNPNLNFDVAPLPQAEETGIKSNYGRVEALALNKQSGKLASAFEVVKILSGEDSALALSQAKALPPVRRDLLEVRPEQAYMEVFYESAIISKAWLVPDKTEINQVFRNMVESVISGRNRPKEAVVRADSEIRSLLLK